MHKTEYRPQRRLDKAKAKKDHSIRARAYITEVKSRGCQLCGYNKCISAIEFHHVGEKDFELTRSTSRSINSIIREMAKCVVICANCHREIHEREIGWVNRGLEVKIDPQIGLDF
jgi:hypothetical protein